MPKFIQICATSYDGFPVLFALDDEGSVWQKAPYSDSPTKQSTHYWSPVPSARFEKPTTEEGLK